MDDEERGSDHGRRNYDRREERGERRERRENEKMPELYSIHKGKVASIRDFGVFVKMEGFERQGLVHISQVSDHRVENLQEVFEEGEKVFVKVIGNEEKVSLSIRLVDQTTGEDKDPNNIVLVER